MKLSLLLLLTLLLGVNVVDCHRTYRDLIPNGCRVPNPCNMSQVWCGVGHENRFGGGLVNQFGVDLAANNYVWNSTLCNMDSDGDGLTNGQELGDPDCTWTAGGQPACDCDPTECDCGPPGIGISHPGICEPLEHPRCGLRNVWLDSTCLPDFNCPAINGPDVRSVKVFMPAMVIPETISTYVCFVVLLPNDTKFHSIASTPLLDQYDNTDFISVYAIQHLPPGLPLYVQYPCKYFTGTFNFIANYQRGMPFNCFASGVGFPFGGETGYNYGLIQVHYTNPSLATGIVASAGLEIYYTSDAGRQDAATLTVGQLKIDIPPGLPAVVTAGECTPDCGGPQSPVSIVTVHPHMHQLGRSFSLKQYRNGSLLRELFVDQPYTFSSPLTYNLDPPIEYLPGDTMRLECSYDSTSRQCSTLYGSTMVVDEMCFALMTYYPPQQGWDLCARYGQLPFCEQGIVYPGCGVPLLAGIVAQLMAMPPAACDLSTAADQCQVPCVLVGGELIAAASCMVPDVRALVQLYVDAMNLGPEVANVVDVIWTCRGMPPTKPECINTTTTASPVTTNSSPSTSLPSTTTTTTSVPASSTTTTTASIPATTTTTTTASTSLPPTTTTTTSIPATTTTIPVPASTTTTTASIPASTTTTTTASTSLSPTTTTSILPATTTTTPVPASQTTTSSTSIPTTTTTTTTPATSTTTIPSTSTRTTTVSTPVTSSSTPAAASTSRVTSTPRTVTPVTVSSSSTTGRRDSYYRRQFLARNVDTEASSKRRTEKSQMRKGAKAVNPGRLPPGPS